ncbi:MAG: putative DNA binding domain-containing protein [Deltaproteobacteria bacterium]|uniref:DNA binding domain-containing protein n=1 Tax=Candidatus Zymogenus saltonus TaxID=2844893 RepID=A0A9D8KHP2_9DELT|nr:putative DNA binding domain-containing protein [Candidatus Zymogenus saltonus]
MDSKIREISEKEALDISKTEESDFYDRKALSVKGDKIQKIAVAFANADGGEFFVGILDDKDEEDPKKRWKGSKSIEDFNPCLQAILEIRPSLDFKHEFLKCDAKEGFVLRIIIEKSKDVHYTKSNKVFQRKGAQSIPLDPQQILDLGFAKGTTSYEDYILNDLIPEVLTESNEIKNFLRDYSPKTDTLDFALNQNLLDNRNWYPKVAGIILFHDEPASIMPKKCSVKVIRYETREDDPEREHLSEQITLDGPLYHLIRKTVDKITELMSAIKIWTTDGLKNVEYPPEAIWEIVVNALIHRDYSISDDVYIFLYDNRIEVVSPGKLPGYVTIENILDVRYSRNNKIVRTLNRYKNAPNKDIGEGLNTAFQKMKDWKLEEPIIIEENNYVKVILPHTPLASPAESILEFLKKNPQITNKQARDITGIKSENTVKNEFYKLRDEDLIERVPGLGGAKSAWRLIEKRKKSST